MLRPALHRHLSRDPDFEILVPGCGNSSLSADLYRDGFKNITNIDISNTVVNQMLELYKDKYPNMPYKMMDVKAL